MNESQQERGGVEVARIIILRDQGRSWGEIVRETEVSNKTNLLHKSNDTLEKPSTDEEVKPLAPPKKESPKDE